MVYVALHFLAGIAGALAIFVVCARLSGARSYSAPFGLVFVGISCAALAHFLSPWATPLVLLAYGAVSVNELLEDRKALRSQSQETARGGGE